MDRTQRLAQLWSDVLGTEELGAGGEGAERSLTGAPLEAVAQVGRSISAMAGVKLPAILFATTAATPAAAARLLDGLSPDSPLRGPAATRLLTLRPGASCGIVLAAPSEQSLLLLRDLANTLAAGLPAGVGLYATGCYDPYTPGWRRPVDHYAERLSGLLDGLPAAMRLVLVGYSAGGTFAHAAAVTQASKGRDVSVMLLDTYIRRGFLAVPRTPRARVRHALTGLIVRMPDAAGRRVLLPRERRRAQERAAIGLPATTEGSMLEWLRSRALVWHYGPRTGTFPEFLVTTAASEQMLGDPHLGWRWVRQDSAFSTQRIPGNHRTMLAPPYLDQLAADVLRFAAVSPMAPGVSDVTRAAGAAGATGAAGVTGIAASDASDKGDTGGIAPAL